MDGRNSQPANPPTHPSASLAAADKRHLWHPFTPMAWWTGPEHNPLVLARGDGVWLFDTEGHRYLDGNSSIWTNIHGHGHPKLVAAIQAQVAELAHCSFLGTSNIPAIRLAEKLVSLFPPDTLTRVFYTDNGSTAIECALKMAVQCRQQRGQGQRKRFAAFANAYHGDTLGASSLGGVEAFFARFEGMGFEPVRLRSADDLDKLPEETIQALAGVVLEPLIQGVNHMTPWPAGMLAAIRAWCDRHDVFLILDEVMTGFGRTGTLFACEAENVVPDFLCIAKGITGGTVPLAATLTTEAVYRAFLNEEGSPEDRTFYYGHSYCGNPVACAAALASLEIFEEEHVLASLPGKTAALASMLESLVERHPQHLAAPRQCGMIAALDIVANTSPHTPFPADKKTGREICLAARKHGLLTRPIGDTLVFMPPLSITKAEIAFMGETMGRALDGHLAR